MRNLVIIVTLLGLAAAALLLTWPEQAAKPVGPNSAATDSKSADFTARYATRPELVPEVAVAIPQQEREQSTERTIRLSSKTRRPDEADGDYKLRVGWLEKLESFERRAKMTPEQQERLMGLLADKQEEAVLGWEAYNRGAREVSPEDRRRMIEDSTFEAYPTFVTIGKDLQRDLWREMRKFLTPKQMVSFRRTSLINSVMGYGKWLPLEIERSPIASIDAGDAP